MPRKKADPIPQDEADMMEQFIPESTEAAEQDTDALSESLFPADPDAAPYPEDPFPLDGTTYMPPETSDSPSFGELEMADPETENRYPAEVAEGCDDLLTELSTAAPEDSGTEAAPLMLEEADSKTSAPGDAGDSAEELSAGDRELLEENGDNGDTVQENKPAAPSPVYPASPAQRRDSRILTINARDAVETDAEREATLWHEIQNAFRTRHILTGTLDTVEQTPSGRTLAVVNYNGFRVAIPAKEMLVNLPAAAGSGSAAYSERMTILARRLYSRLGSEIDFIVKGIEKPRPQHRCQSKGRHVPQAPDFLYGYG